jgi:hypothetical protein
LDRVQDPVARGTEAAFDGVSDRGFGDSDGAIVKVPDDVIHDERSKVCETFAEGATENSLDSVARIVWDRISTNTWDAISINVCDKRRDSSTKSDAEFVKDRVTSNVSEGLNSVSNSIAGLSEGVPANVFIWVIDDERAKVCERASDD